MGGGINCEPSVSGGGVQGMSGGTGVRMSGSGRYIGGGGPFSAFMVDYVDGVGECAGISARGEVRASGL